MNISIPLIMGVLCLTLAGCGGSDSNNRSSSSSSIISSSSSSVESSTSSVDSSSSSSDSSSSSTDSSSSESSSSSTVSSESSSSISESSSSESSSSDSSSGTSESSSSESSSSESSSSESSSSSSTAWTLVWHDDFEGDAIDPDKWGHEVNCWGGGNNEAQCYTDDPANSYVSDGLLHIAAIYEGEGEVCGPSLNQEDPGYPGAQTCKDYSSARLRTRGKADWTYGRMEIRAKMPQGNGVWPALWMLPTDTNTYGGWPHSGEIDIFEAFQPGVSGPQPTGEANEIHGTLHYGISWPWNNYSGASYVPPTNIWDDFYTYAVEWEEGEIRWYVDDVLFAVNKNNWFIYYWGGQEVGYQIGTGAQPFDKAFHMIMNVGLGNGTYVPLPDFTDARTMEVDYVRVYQCSVDSVTGKGCATPANPDFTPTEIAGHVPPADVKDVLWLYRDGLQTLQFDIDDASVDSGLSLGLYECINDPWCIPVGNASSQDLAIEDGPDGAAVVWDIQLEGISNAFIISDDGLNFGGNNYTARAQIIGELKFDLRVQDIDPNTRLRIKLDSGYPNLSYHEIDIPDTGVWTQVAVRFYSLSPNDNESWRPSVDFTNVVNPFVIEPVGGNAHVQLNNIRIDCLHDCNIRPVIPPVVVTEDMDIFVGGLSPEWDSPGFDVYQQDGQTITIDATVTDSTYGTVTEVNFLNTGFGLFYIQDAVPKDLTAFAGGNLEFDLQVVNNHGNNTAGFVIKVDCVYPCQSNELSVPLPADNDWHRISVPIADLNREGFNLTTINTPFAFWPAAGQQGVTFRVANIRWVIPPT